MIFTLIFQTIIYGIQWVVDLLPTGTLPTQVASSYQALVGYGYLLNQFIPIDTLLTLVGYIIIVEIALLSINLGITFYNMIRGK